MHAMEPDFRVGDWIVRPSRDCIEYGDRIIHLAPKAMSVLVCLSRAGCQVVSRQEIFQSVWPACDVTDDALTQRIVEIRKAFGDSARDPRVIETIPKVGFRLIPTVIKLSSVADTKSTRVNPGYRQYRFFRSPGLLVSALVLAMLVALALGSFLSSVAEVDIGQPLSAETGTASTGYLKTSSENASARIVDQSVAVLPFTYLGEHGDGNDLAAAIHEEILGRLSQIKSIKVISHFSTERYIDSRQPISEIAQSLGVATILTGSVKKKKDQLLVHAQLVKARSGEHLWAEQFDRDLTVKNFFEIQTEISEKVASALKTSLSPELSSRISEIPTENFEAYQALLKGRFALEERTAESFEKALAHYKHALELAPDFAQAHIAIAGAYSTAVEDRGIRQTEANEEMEKHALRALSLNPNIGHAYKFLGQVRREQGRFIEAESLFRRALELDPGNVHILHGLGLTLRLQGHALESVPYYDRAVELDPLSPIINESRGSLLRDLERFEEAEQQYLSTLQIDPDFVFTYWGLGTLYWSMGDPERAITWFEQAVRLAPESDLFRSWLALMYLELHQDERARTVLDEVLAIVPIEADNDAVLVEELYRTYNDLDLSGLPDGRNYNSPVVYGGLVGLPVRELSKGHYAAAIEHYEQQWPGISSASIPIDGSNYRAAIYVAFALDKVGESSTAMTLLNQAETALNGIQRLGIHGYWLADVQIQVIRKDFTGGLERLDAAIQAGWRNLWRFYLWHDPIIVALREQPMFDNISELVQYDMTAPQAGTMASRTPAAPPDL